MSEDFLQGARMSIVKPALPYLDVCRTLPTVLAPYHCISRGGEYAWQSMQLGKLLDRVDYFAEIHAAMARCGAHM